MSMNQDTFWKIIDVVNSEVGSENQDGILRLTEEKLSGYSPQDIATWGSIQYHYKELADTSAVFAASCCINEYMSDDSFLDFRMWLISRGKETYLAALKDPDSLAGLQIPENTRFELYGYVASDAFEKASGKNLYAEMNRHPLPETVLTAIDSEIAYFPHRLTSQNAKQYLSALQLKYMGQGATLSFGYRPPPYPSPGDRMSGLEKLQNAAKLIEDMTGCRFKSSVDGPYIYPESDQYLAINMRQKSDYGARLHQIHFDANLQTMGKPMDAAGLRQLQQEADIAHALLSALEMDEYALTPEEMQEFSEFIHEQERQREVQEEAIGPSMTRPQ